MPPHIKCPHILRPEPHGRQASRTVGSNRPAEGLARQTGARFGAGHLTWLGSLDFGDSRGWTLELRSQGLRAHLSIATSSRESLLLGLQRRDFMAFPVGMLCSPSPAASSQLQGRSAIAGRGVACPANGRRGSRAQGLSLACGSSLPAPRLGGA